MPALPTFGDLQGYSLQRERRNTVSECRAWYEGDRILEMYHDCEWCHINHDDTFQFEMLCLEGASVGLSGRTIMHKRETYRSAFYGFDIDACASMSNEELEGLLENPGLIRNRGKIFRVRKKCPSSSKDIGGVRFLRCLSVEFHGWQADRRALEGGV